MADNKNRKVYFEDWGLVSYDDGLQKQLKVFNEMVALKIRNKNQETEKKIPTQNYLFFCEHHHVFTLGKSGSKANLLLSEQTMLEKNLQLVEIGRGGDITYHGPGQLVGYPVLDLDNFFTDIHKYMRLMEECIILLLKDYGLEAGRVPGMTGVWLGGEKDQRKICAMGVKMSRWVSMHGFSLNVNTDLSYFDHIVPCGISDKSVTSLAKEVGHDLDMDEVKERLLIHFSTIFEMDFVI